MCVVTFSWPPQLRDLHQKSLSVSLLRFRLNGQRERENEVNILNSLYSKTNYVISKSAESALAFQKLLFVNWINKDRELLRTYDGLTNLILRMTRKILLLFLNELGTFNYALVLFCFFQGKHYKVCTYGFMVDVSQCTRNKSTYSQQRL